VFEQYAVAAHQFARVADGLPHLHRGESLFRLLAATGLYQRFIGRQRLIHTFASNLAGPKSRLSFVGAQIASIIPLSAASGNVTVSFAVLSYADSLTITLIADPDSCSDLSTLRDALDEELRVLIASTAS
jgi:hypothetical protein